MHIYICIYISEALYQSLPGRPANRQLSSNLVIFLLAVVTLFGIGALPLSQQETTDPVFYIIGLTNRPASTFLLRF